MFQYQGPMWNHGSIRLFHGQERIDLPSRLQVYMRTKRCLVEIASNCLRLSVGPWKGRTLLWTTPAFAF